MRTGDFPTPPRNKQWAKFLGRGRTIMELRNKTEKYCSHDVWQCPGHRAIGNCAGGPGPNETQSPIITRARSRPLAPDWARRGPGPGQGLDWGGDCFPIRHIGTNYDDILFSRGHLTPDTRSTAYITWMRINEDLSHMMVEQPKLIILVFVCLIWQIVSEALRDLRFVPGREKRASLSGGDGLGPSSYIQSHLIFRKC